MRIAIATDAWFPQVNGVVRTLAATVAELDRRGYEVELITPQNFASNTTSAVRHAGSIF